MSTSLPLAAPATIMGMLCVGGLLAQDTRAKLRGEVTDASGGSVAKAKIEFTNVASRATVSTESNESGVYLFQFLDPGEYRLSATVPGFKTFVQESSSLTSPGPS